MARILDVAFGAFIGVVATGTVVALAESRTLDPVQLSPQYYRVRLDNDRVRVYEYVLKPGQKEPMHSHTPGIVYSLSDATIRSTGEDGSVTTHESKVGELSWRDALTHALENVGPTDARALAVELKNCPR